MGGKIAMIKRDSKNYLNVYSSSQSNPWDAQGSQTQTRENYWAIIYS